MARPVLVALLAVALAACSSGLPDEPTPKPKVASTCVGPGRVQYGSACCDAVGQGETKVPGMVYLRCTGPRIGKPCRSKNDCDVACSCDVPGVVLGVGPEDPPSGTRGATGVCTDVLRVGTWMCQIDENGVVGHVIVD
jgi:hypothetical protein